MSDIAQAARLLVEARRTGKPVRCDITGTPIAIDGGWLANS